MSRTIALLLASVTALSLTACDDSSSGAATSTTSSATVPTLADDQPSTTSSTTSTSSSPTTPPPTLTDEQTRAVQAALPETGEGSIVGALGQDGTGLSDASLTPGRHTVWVTCGYGTGTLTVTVIPDMNKKTNDVRTVTCAGKDHLATRAVYRGWLGPDQQVNINHRGPGTAAFGVALTSH